MHSLYLPGQLCNRPHSLETRGERESLQEATRLRRLDRLTIVQKGPGPRTLHEEGNFEWTGKLEPGPGYF